MEVSDELERDVSFWRSPFKLEAFVSQWREDLHSDVSIAETTLIDILTI